MCLMPAGCKYLQNHEIAVPGYVEPAHSKKIDVIGMG